MVVATAATSIRKLMHAGNKRAHLWENSRSASTQGLKELGFNLGTEKPQSAIIAVILPDQETTVRCGRRCSRRASTSTWPARRRPRPACILLRCSLCAEHSDEQVGQILAMFESAGRAIGVIG